MALSCICKYVDPAIDFLTTPAMGVVWIMVGLVALALLGASLSPKDK